jgi:hypothetical protein
MPTFDSLVIPASEYKISLILANGAAYIFNTVESISVETTREEEVIHAIGQQNPIANKRNNAKHSGSLNVQVGEMASFLRLNGLVESTQIEGATLGFASLNPSGIARVYGSVNINSESIDVKSKDKQSIVALKWSALEVTGA